MFFLCSSDWGSLRRGRPTLEQLQPHLEVSLSWFRWLPRSYFSTALMGEPVCLKWHPAHGLWHRNVTYHPTLPWTTKFFAKITGRTSTLARKVWIWQCGYHDCTHVFLNWKPSFTETLWHENRANSQVGWPYIPCLTYPWKLSARRSWRVTARGVALKTKGLLIVGNKGIRWLRNWMILGSKYVCSNLNYIKIKGKHLQWVSKSFQDLAYRIPYGLKESAMTTSLPRVFWILHIMRPRIPKELWCWMRCTHRVQVQPGVADIWASKILCQLPQVWLESIFPSLVWINFPLNNQAQVSQPTNIVFMKGFLCYID